MAKIAVIGAGSWGTALAIVLADNGHEVWLWGRRKEHMQEINQQHTNEQYLPNVVLPNSIVGSTSLKETVADVDYVLVVVPTKAIRDIAKEIAGLLTRPATIIHASKGIEPVTYKRISEMIIDEVPADLLKEVVALSGPSHAEEVSLRMPTTVTVSSKEPVAAESVQRLFNNQHFRVYTNSDLIGVELGGALKNIIALGIGMTNGLGFGDNAKAAFMTRGLAEITRLGVTLGANPLTFSGLSGLGDLIVTCTSVHSRNWRAGNMLGQGMSLDEVLGSMGMVVEGIRTTEAAYHLAKEKQVAMPITTTLYEVLFEQKQPNDAVQELMRRDPKREVDLTSFYEK